MLATCGVHRGPPPLQRAAAHASAGCCARTNPVALGLAAAVTFTALLFGCAPTPRPVQPQTEWGIPIHLSNATHTIAPGDTLYSIARARGTDIDTLRRLNPGLDPQSLEVGEQLRVPPGKPEIREIEQ